MVDRRYVSNKRSLDILRSQEHDEPGTTPTKTNIVYMFGYHVFLFLQDTSVSVSVILPGTPLFAFASLLQ